MANPEEKTATLEKVSIAFGFMLAMLLCLLGFTGYLYHQLDIEKKLRPEPINLYVTQDGRIGMWTPGILPDWQKDSMKKDVKRKGKKK